MLATIIILSIIVAVAIVIFAVKAANVKHAIEDIYAKQALLHDKYCNHEDRIDGNYKSLAELNRRQDEFEKVGNSRYTELCGGIKALQDYNAEREKRAREAVEEFKNTMNCIAEIARKRAKKAAKAKETPATETAQAPDTPATDTRETRDDVMHIAAVNRERFAVLRKTTRMSVHEAAKALGVSLTTAKRYEKWRKAQEQQEQ
nr:MAG TPA: MerR HTH family regulatory protein [Caudoviricetes sp.]